MKQKTNILQRFKQWILSIVIARLLFPITFKKISKKQFGRCITCSANKVCHKYKVCKCTDDEQYEVRLNVL